MHATVPFFCLFSLLMQSIKLQLSTFLDSVWGKKRVKLSVFWSMFQHIKFRLSSTLMKNLTKQVLVSIQVIFHLKTRWQKWYNLERWQCKSILSCPNLEELFLVKSNDTGWGQNMEVWLEITITMKSIWSSYNPLFTKKQALKQTYHLLSLALTAYHHVSLHTGTTIAC